MAEAYLSRGVSPTKEDVHAAIKEQPKGVFDDTFCKVTEDILGDQDYCTIMHADGAGTKAIIAYLYYKETGDASVFKGIAYDSIVMNTDDMLCAGAYDNFVVSNTIGRNAHRISGEILKQLIDGYTQFQAGMESYGIRMIMAGGETADVGDLVSTVVVDSTIFTRLRKDRVIRTSNIQPGDVIIGLASFGQAVYEETYNSGIASNGFTAARHILLSDRYADAYPETYSSTLDKSKIYSGKYSLTDKLPGSEQTIGEALLSPTRTYLPVIKEVLEQDGLTITGLIHCTGGGQGKCKGFGKGLHYIKDQMFPVPPIFQAIQEQGNVPLKEMYQIFNMGHRMEVYCRREDAEQIIHIAAKYGVDARQIGHVVASSSESNQVTITTADNQTIEL